MMERKSASFGPYIMLLIIDTWERTFHEDITEGMDLTSHYSRRPKVKTHNKPKGPNDEAPEEPDMTGGDADPDPEPVETRSDVEPSWLKRMFCKMKKSFCLKLDLQDRLYEEHVNAKKDRQCQK